MNREKKCFDPRCPNTISSQLINVKFCGQCQLQLRELKEQFPRAQAHEVERLYLGGEFRPRRAAILLGESLATFYYHCEEGLVRFRRDGRILFIDSREVLRLKAEKDQWLTLEQAAEETGLPWQRLRSLVYKHRKEVPSRRDVHGRRVVRAGHLGRIKRLHRSLEDSLSARKGVGKQTKSTEVSLSVTKVAEILDCHRDMVLLRIYEKNPVLRLNATKIDNRWYIPRADLVDFCQRIMIGQVRAINRTRTKAKEYLDSIAAG